MWCHRCQLDVPPQRQPSETVLRCGICAAVLPGAEPVDRDRSMETPIESSEPQEVTKPLESPPSPAHRDPCPDLYDERLEQELAEVRQLIRRTAHLIVSPWEDEDDFNLTDCMAAELRPAPPLSPVPAPEPADKITLPSGRWWAAGGWLLVCLGAMGLVFASVLLAATEMGVKGGKPVWMLCLLSAFAGQFLVVLGFMLRCSVGNEPETRSTQSEVEKSTAAPPQAVQPATRPYSPQPHVEIGRASCSERV